jgi:hypothetical protein
MKRIDLTGIGTIDERTGPRELLKLVLEMSQHRPFSLSEMRTRLKIVGEVENKASANGGDYIDLEDAEYDVLKAAYESYPWGRAHTVIVQIADAIEKYKSVSRNKPAQPVEANEDRPVADG